MPTAQTENSNKFKDPLTTAKGDQRAFVNLKNLETLWFNTGTVCNLNCSNCYIESSPENDRLAYLTVEDVAPYIKEIEEQNLNTQEIAFTGGEPFTNPNFIKVLELVLSKGFKALVLTNAYRMINRYKNELIQLNTTYNDKLFLRVSLDHHKVEVHNKERGEGTFQTTLKNIKWLEDNNFNCSIAGRSLLNESLDESKNGYNNTLKLFGINNIDTKDPTQLTVFPEMSEDLSIPEITTDCWNILNKHPDQMMCATTRMIVKRKGQSNTTVLPCTLIAYDENFDLGHNLKDSQKRVPLNHRFCAQFCVLGGASCS